MYNNHIAAVCDYDGGMVWRKKGVIKVGDVLPCSLV